MMHVSSDHLWCTNAHKTILELGCCKFSKQCYGHVKSTCWSWEKALFVSESFDKLKVCTIVDDTDDNYFVDIHVPHPFYFLLAKHGNQKCGLKEQMTPLKRGNENKDNNVYLYRFLFFGLKLTEISLFWNGIVTTEIKIAPDNLTL